MYLLIMKNPKLKKLIQVKQNCHRQILLYLFCLIPLFYTYTQSVEIELGNDCNAWANRVILNGFELSGRWNWAIHQLMNVCLWFTWQGTRPHTYLILQQSACLGVWLKQIISDSIQNSNYQFILWTSIFLHKVWKI